MRILDHALRILLAIDCYNIPISGNNMLIILKIILRTLSYNIIILTVEPTTAQDVKRHK